jgi:hypothetical protein
MTRFLRKSAGTPRHATGALQMADEETLPCGGGRFPKSWAL